MSTVQQSPIQRSGRPLGTGAVPDPAAAQDAIGVTAAHGAGTRLVPASRGTLSLVWFNRFP